MVCSWGSSAKSTFVGYHLDAPMHQAQRNQHRSLSSILLIVQVQDLCVAGANTVQCSCIPCCWCLRGPVQTTPIAKLPCGLQVAASATGGEATAAADPLSGGGAATAAAPAALHAGAAAPAGEADFPRMHVEFCSFSCCLRRRCTPSRWVSAYALSLLCMLGCAAPVAALQKVHS